MPETTAPSRAAGHTDHTDATGLSCMEIWGGSHARRSAVSAQGVDFWVHSLPHRGDAAGGDIHYISVCGSGRFIRSALADVSGHGADVSALARTLRNLMRRHINTPDQTRFARALNEEFAGLELEGKFATAILTTYHTPSESLIVCNAGHPTPLHRPRADGAWRLLQRDDEADTAKPRSLRNLPLGVIAGTAYEQSVVPLAKGDMLMLYTDALIEARSPGGAQLGERGLLDLISGLDAPADDPDAMIDALLAALRDHQRGDDFGDDVTIVLLRANGAKPKLSMSDHLSTVAKLLGLKKV